jgi:sulfur carrier protein
MGRIEMLRVNYKEIQWEEGMTVELLLRQMKKDKTYSLFLGGKATVIVNNTIIPPPEYSKTYLQDGDEVRVYPFIGGG